MADRVELQTVLENILGSRNVYFQPPESVKMSYPAIVYSRDNIEGKFANNGTYKQDTAYEVIVIYKNPDSELPYDIAKLPYCRFSRHYVSDNLYHDAFKLYW